MLEAINIICDVGVNHYQEVINIAKRLNYDSRHLFNEATSGKEKLLQMKQSFEEAEHDEESTAQISVNISQNEEKFKNTIDFVQQYKETRKGMNWHGCHNMLVTKKNVIHYRNSEVLRDMFNKSKKNN